MKVNVVSAGPRAGRREWIGLAVLALPTLLLSLDMSVLYLALPQLTVDLGASSTQQLWIMDIYGFMIAGFLVTMGTLGDRIGRRKLLLIGGAAFGAASVLAAYSNSPEMLIATRALLGVAGATLMPSTMALISNMFRDPKQMGFAISIWISCFMGGMTVGPLVGGVLLQSFWWGSAFLLGVPVMVLLLVVGRFLLPEYKNPNSGRLDLPSVALSLGTILPVVYGLKEIAKHGLVLVPSVALVAGLLVGVAFVRRQRRLEHPMIDLKLFANRTFSSALGINMVTGIVAAGTFFMVNQYLQLVAGLSPLEAGLWQVPATVAMVGSNLLAPKLAHRIRPAYLIGAGLAVTAVGHLVVTQVDAANGLVLLIAGLTIGNIGIGPMVALGNALILSSAPPERAGSAASVSETSAELGIALGVATIGSLGTVVYRNELTSTIDPTLPSGVVDAAREGLATALAAAQSLPGSVGVELVATAREALTSGLTVAFVISTVVFALLAAASVLTLRHVNAHDGGHAVEEQADVPAEEPVAEVLVVDERTVREIDECDDCDKELQPVA
jgi:DHA2 family multidrug resistance protein-like MFS transporter